MSTETKPRSVSELAAYLMANPLLKDPRGYTVRAYVQHGTLRLRDRGDYLVLRDVEFTDTGFTQADWSGTPAAFAYVANQPDLVPHGAD